MSDLAFPDLRDRFRGIYDAVKQDDEASTRPHQGHGFVDHDLPVAMTAVRLAPCTTRAEMAFVAGLLHSTDRRVGEGETEAALDRYLALLPSDFSEHAAEIKEAVLRHEEFKDRNLETRSLTQKLLMDADKLVNMQLLVVVRAGQFHPNIPAIEPSFIGKNPGARYRNPASTYREPTSVLEDLRGCVEWAEPGWFHYTEAEATAQALAAKIKEVILESERIYCELGLAGIEF